MKSCNRLKVTGELQSTVALRSVNDRDGRENVAQSKLAAVKGAATGGAELLTTALALPNGARLEVVVLDTATLGAKRLALILCPTEALERLARRTRA